MPLPSKPPSVRLAQGLSFRPGRHGTTETEFAPSGVPEMPPELSPAAQSLWGEFVELLRPILAPTDAAQLASLCQWLHRYRRISARLDEAMDNEETPLNSLAKLHTMAALSWGMFDRLASKFALSPIDRGKVRLAVPLAQPKGSGVAKRDRFARPGMPVGIED